jgi:hypothetical protein
MSPEDIFEMFFGGAFSNNAMNRRRTQFHFRQNYGQPQEETVRTYFKIYPYAKSLDF